MKMRFTRRQLATAATFIATMSLAAGSAQADLSGNVGVVSKYVLRGITADTENSSAAVQGGFDYSHESGFYAGYWGSSLDYRDVDSTVDTSFENDVYAGWAGDVGSVSLSAGLIYYYYLDMEDANGTEFAATAGVGPVTLGVKYLLEDTLWGNSGDTYLTLAASHDLPNDFTIGATAGYYFYEDQGDFINATPEGSGFRHLDVSLSHPIGQTGAVMSLTYIIGGEDRNGVDQENTAVLGISYAFDI